MSEPLSSRVRTDREVALQAIEENRELRARLVVVEKERDEWKAKKSPYVVTVGYWTERAHSAEAGFAAAREALKEVHEFQCGCDEPGRYDLCVAKPEGTFAALARGGGQQETG